MATEESLVVIFSVSDKTGIYKLAHGLVDCGFTIVASGGTAHVLREYGVTVKDISEITKFNEMLGGRVKTLHPAVYGGILARDTEQDRREMEVTDDCLKLIRQYGAVEASDKYRLTSQHAERYRELKWEGLE
ncbi:MGS-like domain protein [Dictyocaulus viviparus]|uniref:Bifunctional purine biosynthesis protein ATIC n=1 Tax=Dictyocaulus viviparus TaxID=29172 RepID=A0A0D8XYJ0_DICVI|nr:MGS-like domain protein [Dictyocaulus viviparus]